MQPFQMGNRAFLFCGTAAFLLLAFIGTNQASAATTTTAAATAKRYEPNWKSIDARPLPAWYDQAKVGIFIHFGVFSVPSYVDEWFWYWWLVEKEKRIVEFMRRNYPPGFTYPDFGPQLTAEFFNATAWAELFRRSGARYVVLTTKHHEGFTLWPSAYSANWNALDVGPKRDIVGEVAAAVRGAGLRFGAYHSMMEWFHPPDSAIREKSKQWKTEIGARKNDFIQFINSDYLSSIKEHGSKKFDDWIKSLHGFSIKVRNGVFIIFETDINRIKYFVNALRSHILEEVNERNISLLAVLFINDKALRENIDRNPQIIDFTELPTTS